MNRFPAVFALLLLLICFAETVDAQSSGLSFAPVTAETFAPTAYAPDSSANAVYLYDHGEATFDPDYNGHFSIIFERHARVRILNKNGMDLATMRIAGMHYKTYDAAIDLVEGSTYNLQDGNVIETKLDKKSIFKDKNGFFNIEKLAFPDVREGSVIEYRYRIVYPGYGYIPEWEFQRNYPVLWSAYEVEIPTLFNYFLKSQGYKLYSIDTTLYSTTSFRFSVAGNIGGMWSGNVLHRIWAVADMPTLEKAEPYTTTLRNHIQKIQFQLKTVNAAGYMKTYQSTWPDLTEGLMKNDNFGNSLTDRNRFMDDEMNKLAAKGDHSYEAAQRIYAYARDQLACSGTTGIYLSQPLKKTWEDKKGNVADVNLLLTAMYKHAGFEAYPVILSTRTHGYPLDAFPLVNDYDYVIVRVRTDDRYYLLDASRPTAGFGQLPEHCYNGVAHTIDAACEAIPLPADSITEKRLTQVFLSNDADGGFSGTYTRKLGVFESMNLRARLKRETPEAFFEGVRKGLAEYKRMGDHGFDSLGVPEEPLSWHYAMTYHFTQKTLYFYPIMHERLANSPIPNPVRHYPVEMPFLVDNNYVMRMDVPNGYKLDQLPDSKSFKLEDGSGTYVYQIDTTGGTINFHMRMQLKRANYAVSEYAALRQFFDLIVQKEKEPIIFKKIN